MATHSQSLPQSISAKGKKAVENDDHKVQTMLQIVAKQFCEHRMAVTGLVILIIFSSIALFAPVISTVTGLSPDEQNVFFRYQPMMSEVELPEGDKEYKIERFILANPEDGKMLGNALIDRNILPDSIKPAVETWEDALYEVALSGDKQLYKTVAAMDVPIASTFGKILSDFSKLHVLGTDELGRDVLMRLIYGARVSLGVGMLTAFTAALIGLIMGTFAGYYGGWVDSVLSRVTDALLALPLLPLMIVFAAVDLKSLPFFDIFITGQNESVAKLVVIITLFSWMSVSRLIRGSILSIKNREFVLAAKTLGSLDRYTIIKHIIPNVIAPLLVAVTLGVGQAILFESALSFLGLGIQPPTPSWGNMLFNAQEILSESPMLAIFPGTLIFFTVVSFNFIGDGLQDAIDPKSIKR